MSPPLDWDGVPDGTKSLALIIDDPDAPDPKAPRRVWVHWVLYNLPPEARELAAGADTTGLPPGTSHGVNDFKKAAYNGPCPPIGGIAISTSSMRSTHASILRKRRRPICRQR